jgi:hypothetical protein
MSENLNERDHLEDIAGDGRITLKRILKKQDRRVQIGFIWLKIRTGGKLL